MLKTVLHIYVYTYVISKINLKELNSPFKKQSYRTIIKINLEYNETI